MNFPIHIDDEQQLSWLVNSIAEVVALQTTDRVLLNLGLIKTELTRAECYRMASRNRVDRALETGKLKFCIKENKVLIRREDFNKWINKKM